MINAVPDGWRFKGKSIVRCLSKAFSPRRLPGRPGSGSTRPRSRSGVRASKRYSLSRCFGDGVKQRRLAHGVQISHRCSIQSRLPRSDPSISSDARQSPDHAPEMSAPDTEPSRAAVQNNTPAQTDTPLCSRTSGEHQTARKRWKRRR